MGEKHLLIVEDNPQDELLILRALRKAHIVGRIDVVRDGQQALDYLFNQGEFHQEPPPDLPVITLLDISLPRISGLEVLRAIRANQRTALIPVVILTSSDEERDRLASYQNGANSFVRKTLDFNEFTEAVGRLGIYWVAVNEPAGWVR